MKDMLKEASLKELFVRSFRYFNEETNRLYSGFFARLVNWLSMFWCVLRHGASPAEYAHLHFERLNDRERSRYFTMVRFERFVKKANSGDSMLFRDKLRFNRRFAEYLHRDWMDVSQATEEEFADFVRSHGTVMLKATDLASGRGISRYTYREGDDLTALYNANRSILMEEFIHQHPKLAAYNPASTNVPRLNTMLDQNGEPHIFSAFFRSGSGDAVVDNMGAGGMAAHIDVETGIVDTLAIDEGGREYLVHPLTGQIFPGLQIPHWEEAKAIVMKAAREIPDMRYIGWDVAVTEEGVCIVEGNGRADPCVRQFVDRRGWYKELKSML